jgi:hypothetical protein
MFETGILALLIALSTAMSGFSDSEHHNYIDRDGRARWVRLDCPSSLPESPERRTNCRNFHDGLINIGFQEQAEDIRLLKIHEGRITGAACVIDITKPDLGTGRVSDIYCHGKKPFARAELTQRLQTLIAEQPLETRILENPDAGKESDSLFPRQTKAQEVFIELTTKEEQTTR